MPSKAQLFFAANVCIAGTAGLSTLYFPDIARQIIWDGLVDPSYSTKMLGSVSARGQASAARVHSS